MKELKERQVLATGTFRDCKAFGAVDVLRSTKESRKQEPGSIDYCSDRSAYICKWHDNAAVVIASNFLIHEQLRNVCQRVRNASNISVPQPNLITAYNKG